MTRNKWYIVGVVAIVGGLAVASWFATHEQVKKEVREPPTGEARSNPYLALERLLTEGGIETETRTTLERPDPDRSIVVVTDREWQFSPEQVDRWQNWVRDGGHLVLPAPPVGRSRSTLLEALSFEHLAEEGEPAEDGAEDADSTYEGDFGSGALAAWRAAGRDWIARDGEGERIAVSRPMHAGRVTLVADVDALRNRSLAEDDHAAFAWDVVALDVSDSGPTATIVRFVTEKSWLGYAAGHTWPFLVGVLLLIGFALNDGRWGFGPHLPPPDSHGRSRTEHIRATGEFLWKYDAGAKLLESARRTLLAELARRRPSLPDAAPDRKREIVGEELDLDDDELRLLFDDRDHMSEQQFLARIELLERYRRTL